MSRRGRPPHPDILTPREWEVLALLREGLSDQAIADSLGISLDGAKYHVREILSKLGVSSRQEAAASRPEERAPARRWLVVPLAARVAGGLVVVAAVAGLAVLAAGLAVDSEEAATAGDYPEATATGDHAPGAMSALMLAGRQLRGLMTTASVERTTLSAAREELAADWSIGAGPGAGDWQAGTTGDAGDPELWLVRLAGEFDVLVHRNPPDYRMLVPVEMPIGPGDSVERQCTRSAAYVTDDFNVQAFIGPELPASECFSSGQASLEAAVAAAGQASYEALGPRALFDASAGLTDSGTVWEVTIPDLLFEPSTTASPLECHQYVVRLEATSLQVLDTDFSPSDLCPNPPTYAMDREEVQSIAEGKAEEEIYLGTIEEVSVERLRMGDLMGFYFSSGYGGVHSFVDIHEEGLPSKPPEAPAWRVVMRGAVLLDQDPSDLSYDIGGCRQLTVYFDDTAHRPIFMSYRLLDPSDCELPIPTYPPGVHP